MEDLILIPIVLALIAFGFYIMTKVDRSIDESRRMEARESRDEKSKIRIAAENSLLLDAVAPALASCSEAEPHIAFFLSSGRAERIIEKLMADQVDIVLLDGEQTELPAGQCSALLIRDAAAELSSGPLGLPVENFGKDEGIQVVWKKRLKSKDRDRVIFVLESSCGRQSCGCR